MTKNYWGGSKLKITQNPGLKVKEIYAIYIRRGSHFGSEPAFIGKYHVYLGCQNGKLGHQNRYLGWQNGHLGHQNGHILGVIMGTLGIRVDNWGV